MSAGPSKRSAVTFGVFEADLAGRTLRKAGVRVRLQEKPFRVLAMLLDRPGEVVTREELKRELWPNEEYGEFDLGLNTAVKKVRAALGDSGDSPKWIETAPKVGYKFLGPVNGLGAAAVSDDSGMSARSIPRWLVPTAVGLVLAASLVGWLLGRSGPAGVGPRFQLELNPPTGVAYTAFALSPDGTRIAYVGEGPGSPRLWVQSLTDRTATAVEGTENADPVGTPFWSPEGSQVGFFADGKLKRVNLGDGAVQTLCDAPFGRGGSWTMNGEIIFSPTIRSGLWRTTQQAGDCVEAVAPGADHFGLRSPQFLPGGEGLLFGAGSAQSRTDVDAGAWPLEQRRPVVEGTRHAQHVRVSARDYLLYVRGGELLARELDVSSFTVGGAEFLLTDETGTDPMLQRGLFSATPHVLAYLPAEANSRRRELAWFNRAGNRIRRVGEAETFGFSIATDPDGEWALYWQNAPAEAASRRNILRLDLARGITTPTADGVIPMISPDGQWIAYTSGAGIVAEATTGNSGVRVIVAAREDESAPSDRRKFVCDIDRTTSELLFQDRSPDSGWDLFAVPFNGGEPRPVLTEPSNEGQAKWSPDRRWIAYVSDESGDREVYVRPYPSGDSKIRVSASGGSSPRWVGDGNELLYVDRSGVLTSVTIRESDGLLQPGHPQQLFPVSSMYSNADNYLFAPGYTYDVSSDGQRILALWRPPEMAFPPLRIMLNWGSLLEEPASSR